MHLAMILSPTPSPPSIQYYEINFGQVVQLKVGDGEILKKKVIFFIQVKVEDVALYMILLSSILLSFSLGNKVP